jgi:hypothetical protein
MLQAPLSSCPCSGDLTVILLESWVVWRRPHCWRAATMLMQRFSVAAGALVEQQQAGILRGVLGTSGVVSVAWPALHALRRTLSARGAFECNSAVSAGTGGDTGSSDTGHPSRSHCDGNRSSNSNERDGDSSNGSSSCPAGDWHDGWRRCHGTKGGVLHPLRRMLLAVQAHVSSEASLTSCASVRIASLQHSYHTSTRQQEGQVEDKGPTAPEAPDASVVKAGHEALQPVMRRLPPWRIPNRKPAIKNPARHQWFFCAVDYDPMELPPKQLLPPYAPRSAHGKDYRRIYVDNKPPNRGRRYAGQQGRMGVGVMPRGGA